MSASSSRWNLYDLVHLLGYHKLPGPESENADGLGEAVLWLRAHAPASKCLKHLEGALQKLAAARDELEDIHRQLTCVARAIEGDDGIATATHDIALFDEG